jgi:hypothetical protein
MHSNQTSIVNMQNSPVEKKYNYDSDPENDVASKHTQKTSEDSM